MPEKVSAQSPLEKKFSSPQEEIAYLRARVAEREGEMSASTESATRAREIITREELGKYSKFTPQSVLEQKYQLGDGELAFAIERASALSAAGAGDIVALAETRRIKNALSVLEKLNNAFITDEAHRLLIQHIHAGQEIADLKETAPFWNVLHITLFEVTLLEDKGDGGRESGKEDMLRSLISSMEQFYAGM